MQVSRCIETRGATEDAIKVIESPIIREDTVGLSTQVPFARHGRLVTRWTQAFRQGRALFVKGTIDHGCFVIHPRQHGCSGNPAHVLAVEIGEAETTVRQLIEMGGFDFTTKAAEVRIPHIVRHDDQDIWGLGIFVPDRIFGCMTFFALLAARQHSNENAG